jgi:DNA-directed RNA polymerase subunit beta'
MAFAKQQKMKKNFTRITVSLSSPESILERSYGEVLKPETINYRSFKPEKDGLFCEKIFGPVKDWECHCGKYKRIRYKGIICDRCGVEVTQKAVRRERMGHIQLSVPVAHIWYFRSLPNKIGNLLGIKTKDLDKVIYYENYIVIQAGEAGEHGIKAHQLLSEDDYFDLLYKVSEENTYKEDTDPTKFIAKIGGEAVEHLLKNLDLDALTVKLKEDSKDDSSQQRKQEALKRLRIASYFREANKLRPNKPEWMVMRVIPVIPPELRPLVPLEGGRFATSDLNDLYRRVIIRNNRLKRLIEIKAPEVILRNEKRMLQEAVDSLFDNSRKANAVRSDSNRALKSLSDMLKGKQGRFRQNLLGKRVDYSGRSVIVVGPELELHQCGLPKEMAVELFKPFVIRRLIERGIVKTVKSAKKVVDRRTPEVWDILEKVMDGHPVMLNRAPTLHRLGIQAFQPTLIEGKAIRLHPLVCTAFNADFDGDQMAVHVPLSHDACLEAMTLMLSSHNILSPAHGGPVAIPSQDMILGMYYMTKLLNGAVGEGMRFANTTEVIQAFDHKVAGLHAKIQLRLENGEMMSTTVGRAIFNTIVPKELGYVNEVLTKKNLRNIISRVMTATGFVGTAKFLDNVKNMGFERAMRGGLSFSISDIVIPDEKAALVGTAQTQVDQVREQYEQGFITDNERYNQVIDVWTKVNNRVADILFDALKADKDGFNAIYMMADSGARGSKEQIRQLGGMRGLMAKPQKNLSGGAGEIIENPILSNFREGLSVLEYFISTHGARKGLADTALKTADAGYLTRRLVDVAQDVTIQHFDCGTLRGIPISAIKDNEDMVEKLEDRIIGRVSVHDIEDPMTGNILVKANEMITETTAREIAATSIETVEIRSVLTCEAKRGTCALCYGLNLAVNRMAEPGEAVGVVAAQSIGEPGTQLTLRTFHTGGAARRIAAESTLQARFAGTIAFENIRTVELDNGSDINQVVLGRTGEIKILDDAGRTLISTVVPYGSDLMATAGQKVEKGAVLASWDPFNSVIISETNGKISFQDIIEGSTVREERDEQTGHIDRVVTEGRERNVTPSLLITTSDGKVRDYAMPVRARIQVDEGVMVQAGQILAKIPRQTAKTGDITGGLPRITELFEARQPTDSAVVSEIDGMVKFEAKKRGQQEVSVTTIDGSVTKTYQVPLAKHLLVFDGDYVRAGDPLTDGQVAPHDILRIQGAFAVQAYLVNEVQEVYRLQGVTINDKHIEVIVRQMMQKVTITDPGDTHFLEDDQVDRFLLEETNDQLFDKFVVLDAGDTYLTMGDVLDRKKLREITSDMKRQDRRPPEVRETKQAVAEPTLLGITQASLSTDSFISAASFQETTKVLTQAAIQAKSDHLRGLKENVIVGHLVPAGTGLREYRDLIVDVKKEAPKPVTEYIG